MQSKNYIQFALQYLFYLSYCLILDANLNSIFKNDDYRFNLNIQNVYRNSSGYVLTIKIITIEIWKVNSSYICQTLVFYGTLTPGV